MQPLLAITGAHTTRTPSLQSNIRRLMGELSCINTYIVLRQESRYTNRSQGAVAAVNQHFTGRHVCSVVVMRPFLYTQIEVNYFTWLAG